MRLKRFANLDPVEQHNSFKQFNRWRQERVRKLRTKDYSFTVPNEKPEIDYLRNNRSQPTITWVGHSTFLIQHCGLNIITDPVWSGQMAFQKRLAPPGLPIEGVPPIDVVLISHSHYDHLNIQSLKRLAGSKQLLVPAGLATKLRMKGFTEIKELQWWESITVNNVKFTFVPSQHWTRRNLWDTNRSHWGGWVIEPLGSPSKSEQPANHSSAGRPCVSDKPTVYFAGDSGYFQGFKEIGQRFPIDVALMPIGAYEPEWFMGPQHVTPEESLQAFEDTGAKWFVPMHYGAFKLADDTPQEALDRLEAERCKRCIEENRLVILPHGETWKLAGE